MPDRIPEAMFGVKAINAGAVHERRRLRLTTRQAGNLSLKKGGGAERAINEASSSGRRRRMKRKAARRAEMSTKLAEASW